MRRGHHPVSVSTTTLAAAKTNNNINSNKGSGGGGYIMTTTLSKLAFVAICLWAILQAVVFLQWQPPSSSSSASSSSPPLPRRREAKEKKEEEDGNRPLPPQKVVVVVGQQHVDDSSSSSSSRNHHKNEAKKGLNTTSSNNTLFNNNNDDNHHHHHTTTTTTTTTKPTASISTCQFRNNQTLDVAWGVPTFIIGGAQKTGTTSLMYYLSEHSKIVRSKQLEAHFLDWDIVTPWWWPLTTPDNNDDNNDNNYEKEKDDYQLQRQFLDPHTTDEERWCYLRHLYFKEWNASAIFPPFVSSTPSTTTTIMMGNGSNNTSGVSDSSSSSSSPLLTLYSFEKTPSYIHANDFIKYVIQNKKENNYKKKKTPTRQEQQKQKQRLPFLYPNAPQQLLRLCPWAPKIIFILRNPVERAYSQYKMYKRQKHGSLYTINKVNNKTFILSFEDVIRAEIKELRSYNMTTMPVLLPSHEITRQRKMAAAAAAKKNKKKKGAITDDNKATTTSTTTTNNNNNNHIVDERYWIPSQHEPQFQLGMLLKGMYSLQLKYWFRDYPKDSIRVYHHEELERNSREVYLDLLQFCGIPPDNDDGNNNTTTNGGADKEAFQKRFAASATDPMENSTRQYLEEFYAPYNAQLEEVLGPTWKNVWR